MGAVITPTFSVNGNHYASYQYAMSWGDSLTFVASLINGTFTNYAITDLFQNDNDYIVDLSYYPINLSHFINAISIPVKVKLGKIQTNFEAYDTGFINNAVKIFSTTIIRQFNNFLDFQPYTNIKLYVPFFNVFNIDPVTVYGHNLDGYMSIDTHSGTATFYLYLDDNILLDSRSCQLAISLPLGKTNEQEQNRNNLLTGIQTAGSLLSVIIGAYTGNAVALSGGIALGSKTLSTMITNNVDRLTGYNGGNGNRDGLSVDRTIRLIYERVKNPITPDINLYGKILNEYKDLVDLSGFTKVGDIHFDAKGYDIYNDEISEIVSLLQGGVIL